MDEGSSTEKMVDRTYVSTNEDSERTPKLRHLAIGMLLESL